MPPYYIESLDNPYVKYLTKLRTDKGAREEASSFLLSGVKLISDIAQRFPIKVLVVEEAYQDNIPFSPGKIIRVPFNVLKKITGLHSPEAFAAELVIPPQKPLASLKRLLVLDGISDPGNLGTLLRTALGLQWDGVFLTTHTTDPFNDKALRAAQGATIQIPCHRGSPEELVKLIEKENLQVLIASADGKSCKNYPIPQKLALVLGNEAHGVQSELLMRGEKIGIPISTVESLNVASAGAILMYQLGLHV
jgi:TrmH family RNA methyltransferase